jgi:hypothetical protein
MATKKRKSSKRQRATRGTLTADSDSAAAGEQLAKQALAFRAKQRRTRKQRETELDRKRARARAPSRARSAAPAPSVALPAARRALFGARSSEGTLIAEGDSWFDYPGNDVLRLLEDEHLFDVESVARAGDRIEDMAHSGGQFEAFARRLEKLLRDDKVPRAVLLSGGGNDIAGEDFAVLLNHRTSSLPALNEDIVRGLIDVRLRAAYSSMLAGITAIARAYLGRPLPIVTHGYGYAVPDGRGFLGGFWFLPGPWLEPGFRKKGHQDLASNRQVVALLIDRFNAMLKSLTALPEYSHVHYVDLRRLLTSGSSYKRDWANELHPTAEGFTRVTNQFAELIRKL